MNLLDLARSALPSVAASPARAACAQPVAEVLCSELFDFAPPCDAESDREALEERIAILIERNGSDETTARREAALQADREMAWRAFLHNAQRILDAPEPARAALLERYDVEAQARYGEPIAGYMAGTMRRWVAARLADCSPPEVAGFHHHPGYQDRRRAKQTFGGAAWRTAGRRNVGHGNRR
jgi:hypothetical protein